jgi:hypothetical protein
VRLICKQKDDAKEPFTGKGRNVYPIGYFKVPALLERKRLNEPMEAKSTDFAFEVPEDFVPVLIEFKQNNIAQVPAAVTLEGRTEEKPTVSPSKEAVPGK